MALEEAESPQDKSPVCYLDLEGSDERVMKALYTLPLGSITAKGSRMGSGEGLCPSYRSVNE